MRIPAHYSSLPLMCVAFSFLARGLSGRVLDSRPKGRGFKPHRPHCVVSLSKNINPSLVLIQPRKTCPYITERLLMGRKESNQTKQSVLAIPLVTGNVYRDVGLVLPWLQNEMGLYLSYLLFIWAATQENLSGVSARLNSDGLAT